MNAAQAFGSVSVTFVGAAVDNEPPDAMAVFLKFLSISIGHHFFVCSVNI
jgi:hypothetical protein